MIRLTSLPTIRITDIVRDQPRVSVIGVLSSTKMGREVWVAERYLGFLKLDDLLVAGRWHEHGDRWEFVLEDGEQVDEFAGVTELEVMGGYWGGLAELVFDTRLEWREDRWSDPDDHDHCWICWATIATTENREHFVATPTSERVCKPCYQAFVSKRSLGFLETLGDFGEE